MEILILAIAIVVVLIIYQMTGKPISSKSFNSEALTNETFSSVTASGDLDYAEFEVTGVHIAGRKNHILNNCAEYDTVTLKHEKNNEYSDRAIVVKHEGRKIGYIAEVDVEEVHEIISEPFDAHISSIDFDGDYLSVTIAINPVQS